MVRVNTPGKGRNGFGCVLVTDGNTRETVHTALRETLCLGLLIELKQRVVCDAERELDGVLHFSICDSQTYRRH